MSDLPQSLTATEEVCRGQRNISCATHPLVLKRCAPTFFAAERINPNGAQRVTARIIRDFGRLNEREEVIDIEFLPIDRTRERRIGTVRFGD